MRKNHGFTIIEFIGVMALLLALALPLTAMFRTMLVDLPKNMHVVQTASISKTFMRTLETDVSDAVNLEILDTATNTGYKPIAIDNGQHLITYYLIEDKMYRSVRDNDLEDMDFDPNAAGKSWALDNIDLQWNIRQKDEIPQGLQIQSAIKYKTQGRETLKWKVNHLFFIHKQKEVKQNAN